MQQICSLELSKLKEEISCLIDGKIDKIYHIEKKDFIFNFHKTELGKKSLRIIVPNLLYFSEKKFTFPENPSGFCVYLRKYLTNARLRKVEQLGSERILDLVFEKKIEDKITTYHIMLEFFDKGNIIFVDENNMIKYPLENQNWNNRTIRGGIEYVYPKKDFNLFNLSKEDLIDIINSKKIVSADEEKEDKEKSVHQLLASIGFGKDYSLEILKKAKIDPKKTSLKKDEVDSLFLSLNKYLQSRLEPVISKDKFYLYNLSSIESSTKFDTISKAIDSILEPPILETETEESKSNEKKSKVDKIILAQSKRKEEIEKDVDDSQKKGELIYSNYQVVDNILKELHEIRKKHSWKDIKEKLKGHKVIKEIDDKNGTITLDLE
jgi:predicted ribosome quality control (RQC) complex YloA/Tae2 family protein